MSGTINIALTQQFDINGEPLSGGFLYFFAAASTTPQNAFQDAALTIVHPNPIVLPADGRVPMFYLASTSAEGNPSGQIKIRLTDFTGVTVLAADQLLIIGPAGGSGGGGGGADPTTVLQTGDIKARFGVGTLEGFVPCNGETIGSSTSGATERANADCQALFEYLWGTGVLGVFAGTTPARGATANGDWTANKRILTPDLRGRTIAGMDDMGATAAAAGVLTSTFFGTSGVVLGNVGGSEKHTLTVAELALHTHTGSSVTGTENQNHGHQIIGGTGGVDQSLDHTHAYTDNFFSGANSTSPGGNPPGGSNQSQGLNTGTASFGTGNHTHQMNFTSQAENAAHNHNFSLTTNTGNAVTGTAHAIASPAMVMTFYIKL